MKQTQTICSSEKGFTLLELMISVTIVGVIMTIIFGSLRIGVRAWEKGERDVEGRQRQRIVLDLIKHQLSSTCLREVKIGEQQLILFKGDSRSMEFVSRVALVPGNKYGMVYVKYLVRADEREERDRLVFYERNIVLMDDTDRNIGDLDEEGFVELIPDAKSISFEYLKEWGDEETLGWQQSWNSANRNGFPRAVRIILKEEVESAPIYVIAGVERQVGGQG